MSEAALTAEVDIPQFWMHTGQFLAMETRGLQTSWAAPVAYFFAAEGFGEQHWIDEAHDSVIAVRLGGAHVVKAKGVGSGATTAHGGNFTLQPKGTPNWFSADTQCSFGSIVLSDALLDKASESLGQNNLSGRLRADLIFSDQPDLNKHALSYVERGLNTKAPPTRLEMEGRAMLLLDALLRVHDGLRPAARTSGGLSAWQLRRVTEFMTQNAADDLLLDDVATLVNLSAKHFARAFRQSTGLPPHRWLVEKRIERAKVLLSGGDLPLAEIALACGFADQSHFTAAFRRGAGLTPGAYRRETRI